MSIAALYREFTERLAVCKQYIDGAPVTSITDIKRYRALQLKHRQLAVILELKEEIDVLALRNDDPELLDYMIAELAMLVDKL